jgi:ribosomal protein S18 acetylase RimI-like enzyme
MNAPVVCVAALADAPAILALQRLAYQSEARLYNDWNLPPLTQTLEQLQEEFRSSTVLKAVVGEALLGSVRARIADGTVHIGRLVVEPAAQRQGIGSALLRGVESVFPSAKRYELFTGSRSEGNIRLYRRNNYVVTHHDVLSSGVTLVFMSKSNVAAA